MKTLLMIAACLVMVSCVKTEKKLTPVASKKYYRIKQVDKDGKVSYSPVITVTK